MKLVVADASAIAEYLFQTRRGIQLTPLLEAAEHDLHVPSLCDVEVSAVVRRALLQHRLDQGRAVEVLADYQALPLSRHGHLALMPLILGLRANFTAYDATYVALAERLEASFVTADGRLARAIAAHLNVPILAS